MLVSCRTVLNQIIPPTVNEEKKWILVTQTPKQFRAYVTFVRPTVSQATYWDSYHQAINKKNLPQNLAEYNKNCSYFPGIWKYNVKCI